MLRLWKYKTSYEVISRVIAKFYWKLGRFEPSSSSTKELHDWSLKRWQRGLVKHFSSSRPEWPDVGVKSRLIFSKNYPHLFNVKSPFFHHCQKLLKHIWVTFARRFVHRNFQKSPNLVTLWIATHDSMATKSTRKKSLSADASFGINRWFFWLRRIG